MSHAPSSTVHGYGCYRPLKGNPMLEVKPTGQRSYRPTATGSDRSCNDAVARAVSEAFARWLHHQQMRVELPSFRCNILIVMICQTWLVPAAGCAISRSAEQCCSVYSLKKSRACCCVWDHHQAAVIERLQPESLDYTSTRDERKNTLRKRLFSVQN